MPIKDGELELIGFMVCLLVVCGFYTWGMCRCCRTVEWAFDIEQYNSMQGDNSGDMGLLVDSFVDSDGTSRDISGANTASNASNAKDTGNTDDVLCEHLE